MSNSKETLCGSHYWINYGAALNGETLRSRLYRFNGVKTTEYGSLYTFKAVVPNRPNIAVTAEVLTSMLHMFKPFVLDCQLMIQPFNPYTNHRGN